VIYNHSKRIKLTQPDLSVIDKGVAQKPTPFARI